MKSFFGFLTVILTLGLAAPGGARADDAQDDLAAGSACRYALALPNATRALVCDGTTSIYAADVGTTIPAPGVVPLTGTDGKLAAGFVVDRGAGRLRAQPPAGTLAAWSFDESVGATFFANAISGGSALAASGSTTYAGVPGLSGHGLRVSNAGQVVGEAGAYEPSYPITVSVWVELDEYPPPYTNVQGVWKTAGTDWSDPYRSITPFTISYDSTGVNYFGALLLTASSSPDGWVGWIPLKTIPRHEWCLVALSYDGETVTWTLNDQVVGTASQTGAINYANHGYWGVGLPPGDAYDAAGDLIVDDLWVEPVARTPAELAARYKAALGMP